MNPSPHRRARPALNWRATPGLLALLLTACQALFPTPPPDTPTPFSPTPSPTETHRVNLPTIQTVVPQYTPTESAPPTALPTASPMPAPLRFVFPSPGPAPVSAWRPPLYPTPWAPTPYDHFYFGRPIAADQVNWPLANYRYGGVFFKNVVHSGVDIPAPKGTPVLAAGPGRVIWAGFGLYALAEDPNDPYGLAVAIQHDFGYQGGTLYTVYGHMDKVLVNVGQRVNGGDIVGLVGETGQVTGVHLHFEVRLGKNNFYGSRNPELWMSPPQGWGVLAARVMNTYGLLMPRETVYIRSYETNQYWDVNTYGAGPVNSDSYYRENMVIGDLPAGKYEVWIAYEGSIYSQDMQIHPGLVTYFTFMGRKGFKVGPPRFSEAQFTPPPTPKISSNP